MKSHIHPTVEKYIHNPDIASGYDEYFLENRLFNFDCQYLASKLQPPGKVLDAGCGTGRHLLFLHKLGFDVTGLDLSPHFLDVASQKLRKEGVVSPRLVCGDIVTPPAEAGSGFDAVILMFSVLGMVQGKKNRVLALRNLGALLKPGGRLIAHCHNSEYCANPVYEKIMRIRQRMSRRQKLENGDSIMRNYRGLQDLFLHAFSVAELSEIFAESGLSGVNIAPIRDDRTGLYVGSNVRRGANGFFVCAQKNGAGSTGM